MRYSRYRRRGRSYGTRYYSSRRTPGVYRTRSLYAVSGSARRRFGRKRILRVIKSIAEHKYYNSESSFDGPIGGGGGFITADAAIGSITSVPNGSTDIERIGDKTTGTSLEIRYNFYPPLDAKVPVHYDFRLIVFIWKDDTVPTLDDILDVSTVGEIRYTPVIWPYNHDKKIKRKILYDRCHSAIFNSLLNTVNNQQDSNQTVKAVINLSKLRGRLNEINFQNGTTTGVNKIYTLLINSCPFALTPAVFMPYVHTLYTRYNFIDM